MSTTRGPKGFNVFFASGAIYCNQMAHPAKPTPTFDYAALQKSLEAAKSDADLFKAIVNLPFTYKVQAAYLFLGIVVLLLVNKKNGTIDRIALSETELAKNTTDVSVKRFEDIRIPLEQPGNIIAKAVATGKPQGTSDWQYLFAPELTPEEARLNQASGGIGFSAVYPLVGARDGGAMIFSYFQSREEQGRAHREFMKTYSRLVAKRLAATQP